MWHPTAVARRIILSAIILVASTAAAEEPKTAAPPKPAEVSAGEPVMGIVVDPAGTPVAGCKVWLLRQPEEWPLLGELIEQVASDSQGRFAFRPVKPRLPLNMWSESVAVFARDAKGRIGGEDRDLGWRPVTSADPMRIRLDEVQTYRGRVEDSSGHPIADARIRPLSFFRPSTWALAWEGVAWVPPALADEMEARTGLDGEFVLRGVPVKDNIDAIVSAAGFGSVEFELPLRRPMTVRLARAGGVRGLVVCEGDSKAVAGVRVHLQHWEGPKFLPQPQVTYYGNPQMQGGTPRS